MRRDLRSMVDEGLLAATRAASARSAGHPRDARPGPRGRPGPAPAGGASPRPSRDLTTAPGPRGDGGATAWVRRTGGSSGTGREQRADPVPEQREAIAAHAATLIVPGTAILLGPGRTTTALARCLAGIEQLTVVTNSVTVTQALIDLPLIDVVLVGGALRRSIGAVVGPITEQALQGLRGAQVFLSGEGVTAGRGLTTPNVFAAATDQALMAAGRQVVVLADHTKIGHDTMCQTVPSDRIDVLVTDAAADPDTVRRLRAEGVDVRIA